MCEFVTVAKTDDVPEGEGRSFAADGRLIAVFLVEGRYYAMDDHCPHMGASLALGDVRDGAVVCDRHLWAFRLSDGACVEAPALAAETFEVRLDGDEIQVRVPAAG